MKNVVSTFEQLLSKNKARTSHLPALRPLCLVQVHDAGSFTVNLQTYVVQEGSTDDADCTIEIASEDILEEVMEHPSRAWIYSARGGAIGVSDNASAAILLESLYPGTLAKVLPARQFYALFPHLVTNDYAGHTTESFFNEVIPEKIAANPHLLASVMAAYEFDIEGAGTWTIDMTTSPASVYEGPAKTKGSRIATTREIFETVLNDEARAWEYFNSGQIVVSNACRASQVVNAFWPTAFAKGMPGSLYASLFPYATEAPTASEWNKTTGDYITYIQGAEGPVPIHYSLMDDLAIFEGDIILGTFEEMETIRKSVEEKNFFPEGVRIINWQNPQLYIWPGGKVYYKKASNLTNEAGKRLKDAMDHWTKNTNITFQERTTEPNYVVIEDSPHTCSSAVGMRGGEQIIKLSKQCDFGAVVHEIGHTIGLFHEQSRLDRDTYVTIMWDNIEEDKKHNFNIAKSGSAKDLGNYDYGSIMHYGAYDFSKNKQATIVTIPPGKAIGQRNGLSPEDIASVLEMYFPRG